MTFNVGVTSTTLCRNAVDYTTTGRKLKVFLSKAPFRPLASLCPYFVVSFTHAKLQSIAKQPRSDGC